MFCRYETHLINEHGAIFDIDFLIKISLHKQQHSSLPSISVAGAAASSSSTGAQTTETGKAENETRPTQTDVVGEVRCVDCNRNIEEDSRKGGGGEFKNVVKIHAEAANLLGRYIKPEPGGGEEGIAVVSPLRIISVSGSPPGKRSNGLGKKVNGGNNLEEDDMDDEDDNEDSMNVFGDEDNNDMEEDSMQEVRLPRHFLEGGDNQQEAAGGAKDEDRPTIPCWLCPICPMIYKRHSYSTSSSTCASLTSCRPTTP